MPLDGLLTKGTRVIVDYFGQQLGDRGWEGAGKVDIWLPGKGNSKLPWREAGPPNHRDDKVDSDH